MKRRIPIARARMLIVAVVVAAACSVGADSQQTAGVVDITAEADTCFKPLGYQLAATTIVRDNQLTESIGFGPEADFEGGEWNLADSITPIEGGNPSLTPMQALDTCVIELSSARGYAMNQIEERPAPPALTAAVGDCMTKAGFGPDRLTIKVVENIETGQMHIETAHSLPEGELGQYTRALATCMHTHLD